MHSKKKSKGGKKSFIKYGDPAKPSEPKSKAISRIDKRIKTMKDKLRSGTQREENFSKFNPDLSDKKVFSESKKKISKNDSLKLTPHKLVLENSPNVLYDSLPTSEEAGIVSMKTCKFQSHLPNINPGSESKKSAGKKPTVLSTSNNFYPNKRGKIKFRGSPFKSPTKGDNLGKAKGLKNLQIPHVDLVLMSNDQDLVQISTTPLHKASKGIKTHRKRLSS